MNRERLENVRADLAMARHFANSDIAVHAVERAEAALAAGESALRECDVGTLDEQTGRFRRFCSAFAACRECPFRETASTIPCELAWMHMPHASDGPVEVRGPADQAGTPREPHVGQEGAAAVAASIQDLISVPRIRIEDFLTASGTIGGIDWERSDAGR